MLRSRQQEIRVSVKTYATRKHISIRTVRRRIAAGLLRYEQPAPGYPIEIILNSERELIAVS